MKDATKRMGSANPNDPRLLNNRQCVAGFDQLVFESHRKPGEPEGNAYHYVIQESGRSDYPYILNGPFYSEARVPHYFEPHHIDVYDECETRHRNIATVTALS